MVCEGKFVRSAQWKMSSVSAFILFSNQKKTAFSGLSSREGINKVPSALCLIWISCRPCLSSMFTLTNGRKISSGGWWRLHLPIIFSKSRLICNSRQVNLSFVDVWQSSQFTDDVSHHQLHEAQSLKVLRLGSEDLIQAFQVLFDSCFHIPPRCRNLKKKKKERENTFNIK